MLAYHMARGQSIEKSINLGFSVTDLKKHLKSGVLSLCTATGLMVFYSLMEEEVTSLVGPKGKHDPNREAYRHGTERSSIVLAGQRIPITHPRVRSIDGRELPIESFEMVRSEDPLCEVALARMLHGLSSRPSVSNIPAFSHFLINLKNSLSSILCSNILSNQSWSILLKNPFMSASTI